MMNSTSVVKTVVLAAGGTGGHVFPAEAVAEECIRLGYRVILITDKRFNSYGGTLGQIEKYSIRAGTFGRGLASKVTAVADICIGLYQALALLRKIRPDAMIGFGGYPSYPTVRAACMLGIPSVIHEQNSVLGRANRMLSGHVSAIATSFPDTTSLAESYRSKTVWVGNPVRSSIKALRDIAYTECSESGVIRLLVTGGSQGASLFSTLIPHAISLLPPSLRTRIRVDQQCRDNEVEATKAKYKAIQLDADVASFFTDIPARLASTHLVIGRAGASTLSELAVAGRPSILIPLPSAMDNHQYYNAKSLEAVGGIVLLEQKDLNAGILANQLEILFTHPQKLSALASNAKAYGKVHAAHDLVQLMLHAASGNPIIGYAASECINHENQMTLNCAKEKAA
jgi:UDP-N-acetylglucosamine--N-acetylmuramyl-(pentapeptide) pyrophosphoryl-undecaprenol N-acetylglucosamine transferase